MPITNYMLQDLLGVFSGVLLFALVLVMPGYVIGHMFDLLGFKKRQPPTRLGIGLLLSCAISPILFFLTYRLVSNGLTLVVLCGFTIAFILIVLRERDLGTFLTSMASNRFARAIAWIAGSWIVFAALMLVDVQWGDQLYFNIVSYDYSTRAAVVNAITRSGVPPLNPSFYPGQPVKLTFLYYFWYILCSLVDQMGGEIVDSRAALVASVIWAGLALITTIAVYLRIRCMANPSNNAWHAALLGIGLLAVSGLDILSSSFYMIYPQFLMGHAIDGDIEHWNEQITAWVGTTVWTPHHLVALLNGILGWLLIVYHQGQKPLQRISSAAAAGLAFASAFGLSSWVTLIFIIFWIIWIITRLLSGDSFRKIWIFLLPGIVAAIAILPFAIDLYGGSAGGPGAGAFAFDVRWFWPATVFIMDLPHWQKMAVHLLLLPLNYFFELGFFLLVGIYWYRHCGKELLYKSPLARGEIILLLTSVILVTFFRSTLILNNDFGWRGWLPGQFVLLIWGTDILACVGRRQPIIGITLFRKPVPAKGIRGLLTGLLTIGVLTSLQDVFLLRTWPMLVETDLLNRAARSKHSGKSVYEARAVYERIEDQTPASIIIQSNPGSTLDRPAGLYRTRNSVIAHHTLYGIAPETFSPWLEEIGSIFKTGTSDWQSLDAACRHYSIGILIIKDTDALWNSLDTLSSERQPLFIGNYYAAFYCGNYAESNQKNNSATSQVLNAIH